MRIFKGWKRQRYTPIFLLLLMVTPGFSSISGIERVDVAVAAKALELANEGKIQQWTGGLPLVFTEPSIIQRRLLPGISQEPLRQALEILRRPEMVKLNDDRLLWTRCAVEASLGEIQTLPDIEPCRQDLRREFLDLALYLQDLKAADHLVQSLESEGTDAALTYRRAIIAYLKGEWLLADSLTQEALLQGLPLTSAAYKDLYKLGFSLNIAQPKITSVISSYLNTLQYLQSGNGSAGSWLYPEGFWRGRTAFLAGRFDEALREWRPLQQPALKGILGVLIGQAYMRLGDYQQAQTQFQQVTKTNPETALAYLLLATAFEKEGKREQAAHWREMGTKQTGLLFLKQGVSTLPMALPQEARLIVEKEQSFLTVAGSWLKGSNGLWLSSDRGKTWLWSPLLNNRILLPKGDVVYVIPSGVRGDGRIVSKTSSKVLLGLNIQVNVANETAQVKVESTRNVRLVFEYWTLGGQRNREIADLPKMSQELVLKDTEPGRSYQYRVIAIENGIIVHLTEGNFRTADQSDWESMAVIVNHSQNRDHLATVRPQSVSALTGKLRWKKAGADWSDWMPVSPEVQLAGSFRNSTERIELQYQDAKGFVSPVIHETLYDDRENPLVHSVKRERLIGGETVSFRTNELTLSHVWIRQNGVWLRSSSNDRWSRTHLIWVPSMTEHVRIWVEDPAGNLSSIPDTLDNGPIPISFRINGGENGVNNRWVQLVMRSENLAKMSDAVIRFSNGEGIWSPWEAWRSVKTWRLSGGVGEKNLWMQVKTGDVIQTLVSTVQYDSKAPLADKMTLRPVRESIVSLTWQTDEPTRCRWILFPKTGAAQVIEEDGYSSEHRMIADLQSSDQWRWYVEIWDRAGNHLMWRGGSINTPLMKALVFPSRLAVQSEARSQRVTVTIPEQMKPLPSTMRWRRVGSSWSGWRPYEKEMPVMLQSDRNEQQIEFQFKLEGDHLSPVFTHEIQIDQSPPKIYGISLSMDASGYRLGWKADERAENWVAVIPIAGKWRDPLWQSVPIFAADGNIQLPQLAAGDYAVRIFARDSAGNWSCSSQIPWSIVSTGNSSPKVNSQGTLSKKSPLFL